MNLRAAFRTVCYLVQEANYPESSHIPFQLPSAALNLGQNKMLSIIITRNNERSSRNFLTYFIIFNNSKLVKPILYFKIVTAKIVLRL